MLRRSFFWYTRTTEISSLVNGCIHCYSTMGSEKVPRTFGTEVNDTASNNFLQFDCIELGPSIKGACYLLMIRDEHRSEQWIFKLTSTSKENSENALMDWCDAFGHRKDLMQDGSTYFRNETIRLVVHLLRKSHHLTDYSDLGVMELCKISDGN